MIIERSKLRHIDHLAEQLFVQHTSIAQSDSRQSGFLVASFSDAQSEAIDAIFTLAPTLTELDEQFVLVLRTKHELAHVDHLLDFWKDRMSAATGFPVFVQSNAEPSIDYVVSSRLGGWIALEGRAGEGEIVSDPEYLRSLLAHFRYQSEHAQPAFGDFTQQALLAAQ